MALQLASEACLAHWFISTIRFLGGGIIRWEEELLQQKKKKDNSYEQMCSIFVFFLIFFLLGLDEFLKIAQLAFEKLLDLRSKRLFLIRKS